MLEEYCSGWKEIVSVQTLLRVIIYVKHTDKLKQKDIKTSYGHR